MKLRIRGNSIRYRLTRSEVEYLATLGIVEETTSIGEKTFTYGLYAKDEIDSLQIEFQNDKLALFMPAAESKSWHLSNRVGFENNIPLNDGKFLHLLLEKDFVCLDDNTEDQSDQFPNPLAQKEIGEGKI